MDYKLIKQFGVEILSLRIRSQRNRNRMRIRDLDKHLIALWHESNLMHRERNNPCWDLVSPPVQKGWKRFFLLREDLAKSDSASFFEGILKKINTYNWSYRKDFKVRKRKNGRKTYVVKDQYLYKPAEREYLEMNFTEEEQKYFHVEFHIENWSRGPVKRYAFNDPWRFVLKVKPSMVNRMRRLDSEIQSRLDNTDNYIKKRNLGPRQSKIMEGSAKGKIYWEDEKKIGESNPLKNKSIERIIDEAKEELI